MATQTITVTAEHTNETLYQEAVKFPRIADALADTWEIVNSILASPIACGGSFANERSISLHMEEYSIHLVTTR